MLYSVTAMGAIIMDGRAVSGALMPEVRRYGRELIERHRVTPGLAAVLVGDDPGSRQYVRNKRRLAAELGFRSELVSVAESEATTESLAETIARLNGDERISGILL